MMKNRVLNLDQLAVESFALSAADQETGAGEVETGCMSDCVSGCGFGGIC